MPTHVYANTNEIASKAADGKSIAAFPDVCFSPPAPPVGPLPLPYPNTGEVKDTDKGTAKVFVKDKMVGMEDSSYMTKSMGDEPATPSQGKGIITGALQGKCYFGLWSMDVQMEGKCVPSHLDMVTHNHGSFTDNGGIQNNLGKKSNNEDTGEQNPILDQWCYCVCVCDHNGYYIKNTDFFSKYKKYNNYKLELIDSTAINNEKEIDKGTYFHESPKRLPIYLNRPQNLIKTLLYNRYCLDKDIKRDKITEEKTDEVFQFIGPKYSTHLVNFSKESCSKLECKGHIQKYIGIVTPSPHFPILNSGSWDRTTAYNLAVLSAVAYGDLAQNESGTFEGSLLDITENLLVPNSQCGLNNNHLELERTDYNYNFIYCNDFSCSLGSYGNIIADNKKIVISFRGTQFELLNKTTESIKDIVIDIFVKDCTFCNAKTHSGFYLGYTSISSYINE